MVIRETHPLAKREATILSKSRLHSDEQNSIGIKISYLSNMASVWLWMPFFAMEMAHPRIVTICPVR
uniref:Uncharacterized protein n=1 Tax=Pristionchus pacificus TaxID=54126 RepID=A0A2A6B5L1_PRIPA|eukprot:PDM61166.1 hypothetical protein PRIPAC_50608 [Pristionchus pacificus]